MANLIRMLPSLAILALSLITPMVAPTAMAQNEAERGALIFKQRCRLCHDEYTKGEKPLAVGPRLNGLFKREELIDGKSVTDENVAEVIRTGPTSGMPAFRYTLSNDEIRDLVAYLKTK